jgi:hypothetical protein
MQYGFGVQSPPSSKPDQICFTCGAAFSASIRSEILSAILFVFPKNNVTLYCYNVTILLSMS